MGVHEQIAIVLTGLLLATLAMLVVGCSPDDPIKKRKRALDADEKEAIQKLEAIEKKINNLIYERPWSHGDSGLYDELTQAFGRLEEIRNKKRQWGVKEMDTGSDWLLPKTMYHLKQDLSEKGKIQINGLKWPVTINILRGGWMKIGCEDHPLDSWALYDDRDILEKGGKEGLRFWRDYRDALFALAGRQHRGSRKEKQRTYKIGDRFQCLSPHKGVGGIYRLISCDGGVALLSEEENTCWDSPYKPPLVEGHYFSEFLDKIPESWVIGATHDEWDLFKYVED